MGGQQGVVRLNDRVRDLRAGDNRKGGHHSVRVLLTDLAQKQRSETGTGAASQRMEQLETLQTVSVFRLLTDIVEHLIDKLGTCVGSILSA